MKEFDEDRVERIRLTKDEMRAPTEDDSIPDFPLATEPMPEWRECAESEYGRAASNMTERLRVPSGWLYRCTAWAGETATIAMCFVPESSP